MLLASLQEIMKCQLYLMKKVSNSFSMQMNILHHMCIYSSLKKQELKECLELVSLHRQEFLEVWNDWFIR